MTLQMSAGFGGSRGLKLALGLRAPVSQPVFRSILIRLLPHSLFAAKSEIDHLAHAMTRALRFRHLGTTRKAQSDLLCRYQGTDNTHFNLVRPH